jgi:effector-binding domain-containing protein
MKQKMIIMKLVGIFIVVMISACGFKIFSQEKQASEAAMPKIEIKQVDVQKAVIIKAEVAASEVGSKMGEIYGKLFAYLDQNGITSSGSPFAVYYTFDPNGKTIFEAGIPVSSKVKGNNEITYKEYPAMKVVSLLYIGSYESMTPCYEKLSKYMTDNGLKGTGSSWEVYLTDPQEETDKSKYQTIIYLPVK